MNGDLVAFLEMNAPLIVLVAPLLGAALAMIAPNARTAWIAAISALAFGAVAGLEVMIAGAPGDPRYLEIVASFTLDGVGLFAAPILIVTAALALLAMGAALDLARPASAFAVALFCVMTGAWIAAVLARDTLGLAFAAGVGWLAAIGLVAMAGDRDRAALSGSLRMLSAGAAAIALMLVGLAVLARGAGAFDLGAFSHARIVAPDLSALGAGLLLIGLAALAGAAPLHLWIGAAYSRAGGAASLAMAAVGVIGAVACLMRVAAAVIPAPALGGGVGAGLGLLGGAGVLIASVQAVGARSVRRLGAYACAAQAGFVLLGLAVGSPAGVTAGLMQLTALAAAMLGFFGGVIGLPPHATFDALDGRGRRAPIASAALALAALSLIGAPLTLGFLARWRLLEALVISQWWWAAVIVIAATLASMLYCGRLLERLYVRRATVTATPTPVWRAAVTAPALLAAVLAILIGVAPAALVEAAERCAYWLMGQAV